MQHPRHLRLAPAVTATVALITLAACGSDAESTAAVGSDAAQGSADQQAGTVEVTDFQGSIEVPLPAERLVVTDNRVVRAVDAWGVDVVAAPLDIFPEDLSFTADEQVINLGNHGEPDMEALVAADPDLVLNGYRFEAHYQDVKDLVPDAVVVDTSTDPEGSLQEELTRQITLVGEALGHQDGAAELVADLDASIERAAGAYDADQTVMGLLTSGGDISYVAPVTGRSIGPVFETLGLNPALEQAADDTSHGDDISVEAIAGANPDWLLVMDRDAAIAAEGAEFSGAEELISGSEALQNVTAVQEGNIIYLPANFYLTEDIQAYTEFFNAIADAMSAS